MDADERRFGGKNLSSSAFIRVYLRFQKLVWPNLKTVWRMRNWFREPKVVSESRTLESSDSVSKTNWSPVAGGPWPTRTNQWTVPLAAVSNRFFRVKAELQA